MNVKKYTLFCFLMFATSASAYAERGCSSESDLRSIKKLLKCINKTVNNLAASTCSNVVQQITQVDIPLVITEPGTYCLASDVTLSTENVAITIKTSGVILDLNNYAILLDDEKAGGIFVELANDVVIKNGFITSIFDEEGIRPDFGICISAGISVVTTNVVITGCRDNFFMANSCFIDLIDSTFRDGFNGINMGHGPQSDGDIRDGSEEELIGKQLLPEVMRAVEIEPGFNFNTFKIINCKIILNENFGIYINPPFEDSIIKDSIIDSNGKSGIVFDRNSELDTSCIIDSCLVSNNGGVGIDLRRRETNFNIVNCQLKNNEEYGCKVTGGDSIEFNHTQIYASGVAGLLITRGSSNIAINDCKIIDAGETPLQIFFSSAIIINNCLINSFFDSISAMYCNDVINLAVSNSTISSISNAELSNGCVLRLVSQAVFRDCIFESASLGPNGIDGNTIFLAGGVDNFTVVNSTIGALYPNGPDVGIGAHPDELAGINTNVVIDNCVVTNAFFTGIQLDSVLNGVIRNSIVATTVEGPGILLQGSAGIMLSNNTVNDNVAQGVVLDENTQGCLVRDNTIYNNIGVGLLNDAGALNKIYHNIAYGNVDGNYVGVDLVFAPAAGLGVLENISDDSVVV